MSVELFPFHSKRGANTRADPFRPESAAICTLGAGFLLPLPRGNRGKEGMEIVFLPRGDRKLIQPGSIVWQRVSKYSVIKAERLALSRLGRFSVWISAGDVAERGW